MYRTTKKDREYTDHPAQTKGVDAYFVNSIRLH